MYSKKDMLKRVLVWFGGWFSFGGEVPPPALFLL